MTLKVKGKRADSESEEPMAQDEQCKRCGVWKLNDDEWSDGLCDECWMIEVLTRVLQHNQLLKYRPAIHHYSTKPIYTIKQA